MHKKRLKKLQKVWYNQRFLLVSRVVSPLAGQVKPLSQATDPVFSSGVMGQGVVIEPSQGELVSPVNGTVTVLFPTKHAVGIVF